MGKVRDCSDLVRGKEVTTPKGENDPGVKGSALMVTRLGTGVLLLVREKERRRSGAVMVSSSGYSDCKVPTVLVDERSSIAMCIVVSVRPGVNRYSMFVTQSTV